MSFFSKFTSGSAARYVFESVDLGGFPVLATKEWFGEQSPDDSVFLDALNDQLAQRLKVEIEQIQLFNGGSSRHSLAFVYCADLSVRGLEFTGDSNLISWLTELSASFGGSTVHKITKSGMNGSRFSEWDALLAEPQEWAKKHAPKSHFKVQLTNQKANYFAFDSVSPVLGDAVGVSESLQALLAIRGAQPSAADLPALKSLEDAVGVPLPSGLKEMYAFTGAVEGLFHGFDLLSPAQAQSELEGWSKIYNEWTLDDLKDQQSADTGIHAVYCTPRWIPFVNLVGGNFLAIDLCPAKRGTYGQVITFGADISRKRLVTKNLGDFLKLAVAYDGSKKHDLYAVFGELKL